jgi:hypothetical protein
MSIRGWSLYTTEAQSTASTAKECKSFFNTNSEVQIENTKRQLEATKIGD